VAQQLPDAELALIAICLSGGGTCSPLGFVEACINSLLQLGAQLVAQEAQAGAAGARYNSWEAAVADAGVIIFTKGSCNNLLCDYSYMGEQATAKQCSMCLRTTYCCSRSRAATKEQHAVVCVVHEQLESTQCCE